MIELLTPLEMQTCDRATIVSGVCGLALMERAGAAVADSVMALVNPPASVVVLCGPGNNGGDGFVAARRLDAAGYGVRLALLGDPATLAGDAAEMARRWTGPVETFGPGLFEPADVIVDALFGAGLSRPLDGEARRIIEALSGSRAVIVAVDVPSGVDGATGAVLGVAPRADVTVTFFRAKPGHYLLPGRALVGRLVVADIGIPTNVLAPLGIRTFLNGPSLWRASLPRLQFDTHKYRRGHAVVLSGPVHRTGAARLAARAALRVGAGLVTVASPPEAVAVHAAHLTAIMIEIIAETGGLSALLADTRINAVLIGPAAGVTDLTRESVRVALESRAAVVLDADALTVLADDRTSFFKAIAGRTAAVIMTPHEGELARLLPGQAGDKLARAREIARLSGAIVVLKGSDTFIAEPSGRVAINANAPAWLATAGSGDVLAGMVAGLAAAGMPPFEAAAAAVHLHGAAGQSLGPGLIADDLPEALPAVLRGFLS